MHGFKSSGHLRRFVPIAWIACFAVCGCRREPLREQAGTTTRPPATSAVEIPHDAPPPTQSAEPEAGLPSPEPLTGEPLTDLAVEGHPAAVVSLPVGVTEPRPVIVATHGNFDRPEWQCEVWRNALPGSSFVLCPRGNRRTDVPRSQDRWTYSSAPALEREISAGLAALRARFNRYLRDEPPIFVGFSLGAILGVRLLAAEPAPFRRAVLIEGGQRWTAAQAKQFASGGGERILFVCAQAGCRGAAEQSARVLKRAGIEAKVADAGHVGHTYDGAVAEQVAEHWPWLTATLSGDPR